jgi:hypothetical protein
MARGSMETHELYSADTRVYISDLSVDHAARAEGRSQRERRFTRRFRRLGGNSSDGQPPVQLA